MSQTVRYADLEIGDIVRIVGIDDGYNDATVYNVADGNVHFVRVYVSTSDFIATGGCITYIGQEKFSHPACNTAIELLRSAPPEATRDKVRAILADVRYAIEHNQGAVALEKLRSLG